MIAKELAKQLQDAGFPLDQSGKGGKRADPTLSALIQACEPNHFTLEQEDEQKWIARQRGRGAGGSSPEEAVAHLWLILHALRGASA